MTTDRWRGDVSAGVDAWTRGRRRRPDRPSEPPAEEDRELGPEPDHESVARTILLDQLTGRARSRKELADKLASRNVPEEVATPLLDRFEEVGLVDDAAFARLWVESRHRGKGLAPRALAAELRRKGVADELVKDATGEIGPEEQEQAARALVRRKLRSVASLERDKATRRLVGMLARKGYSSGLAFAVVKDELGAEPEEFA